MGSSLRNRDSLGKKGAWSSAAAAEKRSRDHRLREATERLLAGMGTRRAGMVAARAWTVNTRRPWTAAARVVEPRSGQSRPRLLTRAQKAPLSEDPSQLAAATIMAMVDMPWSSRAGKGRRGQGLRERVMIPGQIQTRVPGGPGTDIAHGRPQEPQAASLSPRRQSWPGKLQSPALSRVAAQAPPGALRVLRTAK